MRAAAAFLLAVSFAVSGCSHVDINPLGANWDVEEVRLSENTYRLSMKMRHIHTGGAGEAIQLFKQRASQLQYENGYHSYQILEYTEGVDSRNIIARRMAEGVVRLVQQQQADSFLQN